MRLRVLKHVEFEGPGAIAAWAAAEGHALALTELGRGETLPGQQDFDALVLMGGPMSVNEEDRFPWLRPEKALVREAIAQGKKVLGVCLGAQLIASALGAEVRPNACKEIGWYPVEAVGAAASHAFLSGLPATLTVFHWHGETFDLPKGAVQLWRSAACEQQAYALGKQVLALQCHLEVDSGSLGEMVANGRSELAGGGPWIQAEAEILARPERLLGLRPSLDRLLGNWAGA